jgi:hypothetical protein
MGNDFTRAQVVGVLSTTVICITTYNIVEIIIEYLKTI